MRISVGSRTYDLTTRALVVAAHGPADELVEHGADIVAVPGGSGSVPAYATVPGPGLVRLTAPTADLLKQSAEAGGTVVVPAAWVDAAAAAGLSPDRIVPDTLFLDVTTSDCVVAATAVGVVRGARIILTTDVRGARRICDVLAAVLEAR
ncbi:MAG: hypothetical protein M3163_07405 [Actinomycetota bacterium]|nr:hypothetical protein [Actinomycetota bacterium]